MDAHPLRILHLEDDPADAEEVQRVLTRAGLSGTFQRVNTKEDFIRALAEFQPDVVLCDHALEHFGARAALEYLRASRLTTPLIVVTGALTEQLVVDYVRAGVADYVSKASLDRLAPAIEAAVSSRQALDRLTPRQSEVLRLIAEGHSTGDIARKLEVSIKTVESHRMALMDRLGIHDLAGLIRFAIHVGLVPPAT
jgi:DNA-binding NarL/FixJ family response regulator